MTTQGKEYSQETLLLRFQSLILAVFYLSAIKHDFGNKLPGKREGSSVCKGINPPLQKNVFPVNTRRKGWAREERPPWTESGGAAVRGAQWDAGVPRASPGCGQPGEQGRESFRGGSRHRPRRSGCCSFLPSSLTPVPPQQPKSISWSGRGISVKRTQISNLMVGFALICIKLRASRGA